MSERPKPEQAPSPDVLKPRNVRRLGLEAARKSGLIIAGNEPDQIDVLRVLEPVVADELNRHNSARIKWVPADLLPRDLETGRIFFNPENPDENIVLSPAAQSAMIVNLLTEDNLPAYHRTIADNFGIDGAWGTWTNQWTAEESNHATIMRDFLLLADAVSPAEDEAMRMEQMKQGYAVEKDPLHTLAYVTFQELATRVSHRQTGIASNNKLADAMLKRIAQDENFHMLFYRNLAGAALDVAPNQMMQAIRDEVVSFEMPGANIEGFKIRSLEIANAGIYDLRRHLEEVIMPVLRKWKIFEREDFSGYGEKARNDLAAFIVGLEKAADDFDANRDSGRVERTIAMLKRRAQGSNP